MNYDIVEALSQIAREKGVDLQVLVDRLEASLRSAAKKKYGVNAQITVNFDRNRGGIEMFMTKTVVRRVSDEGLEMTAAEARRHKADASVGDQVVIPLDIAQFGRNAIQAAKQMLIQGVREAERERVFTDFADKVGTVVRGVVQQVDRGNIVLKLDTAEAIIPAREVMHRDRFRLREMVRALVIKVDREVRGPQVILSRTSPQFLLKLFQSEVPEIAEHVVEVKAVAREAGFRSKIAVVSNDPRIDAVGACVGIKGSRVQSIVKELGGERIDIVPYSQDPVVFVSRSLGPAKAIDARVNFDEGKVTVVVADDQLSLAIGKQGQNVRLAAKLTGWKIELHSESEFQAKAAAAGADVTLNELEGIPEGVLETLKTVGIESASDVERVGLDGLATIEGLAETTAERVYGVALAALATARAEAAAKATGEQEEARDIFGLQGKATGTEEATEEQNVDAVPEEDTSPAESEITEESAAGEEDAARQENKIPEEDGGEEGDAALREKETVEDAVENEEGAARQGSEEEREGKEEGKQGQAAAEDKEGSAEPGKDTAASSANVDDRG